MPAIGQFPEPVPSTFNPQNVAPLCTSPYDHSIFSVLKVEWVHYSFLNE
jgi:hypothetical protein